MTWNDVAKLDRAATFLGIGFAVIYIGGMIVYGLVAPMLGAPLDAPINPSAILDLAFVGLALSGLVKITFDAVHWWNAR